MAVYCWFYMDEIELNLHDIISTRPYADISEQILGPFNTIGIVGNGTVVCQISSTLYRDPARYHF